MKRFRPSVLLLHGTTVRERDTFALAETTLDMFAIESMVMELKSKDVFVEAAFYAEQAQARGVRVFIASATVAHFIPVAVAAVTIYPVIALPIEHSRGAPNERLLKKVMKLMGDATAFSNITTVAIGAKAGGTNAALLAARMLGAFNPAIAARLAKYVQQQADSVAERPVDEPVQT